MKEQLKAEAFVRDARPALMELTFGCEVKDTHNQQYYKVCNKSVNGDLFVSHGSLVSNQYRIAEDRIIIIGHPIALQDWLAVLSKQIGSDGRLLQIYENTFVFIYKGIGDYGGKNNNTKVIFNLTTGQPATQADFKAFNDIISV